MKKGFTLVELSIVLVIIGLLIGGILVAESMISTAKTQQLIRIADQYLVAAKNFKTKYNFWPGDVPDGTFGCAGNGDGKIALGSAGGCGATGSAEGQNFFYSLSLTEMTSQPVTLSTDVSLFYASADGYFPKGPDKNSHFAIYDYIATADPGILAWNNNVIQTSSTVGINSSFLTYTADCEKVIGAPYGLAGIFPCAILTAQEALSIDKKIDDGMPNSGSFIADEGYMGHFVIPTYSNGNCSAVDTSYADDTYSSATAKNCFVGWKIQE